MTCCRAGWGERESEQCQLSENGNSQMLAATSFLFPDFCICVPLLGSSGSPMRSNTPVEVITQSRILYHFKNKRAAITEEQKVLMDIDLEPDQYVQKSYLH